jgi:hypothetical protein
MTALSHRLKLEVTLNGSGFETPAGGGITKNLEIPTASLSFPNPFGSFSQRFSPRDVFRIYVGKDALPDTPTFVGYPVEGGGEEQHTVSLMGRLHACETEYLYLDDYDNFDGWEVSKAIQEQLTASDIALSPALFGQLKGTNPAFFIPQDYRKPDGITRYQFIKFARELAYDVSSITGEVLKYYLHEHGNGNYMLSKQMLLTIGNEWKQFTYGDNLLASRPSVKSLGIVNRQTVFAKTGERVTFDLTHDQQIGINGVQEGKPIKLSYGSVEEAFNRARLECLTKRSPVVTSSIKHLDLIEAVPGISSVRLFNSPHIMNGMHRVMSLNVNFSSGLEVTCELEREPPILSRAVIDMIVASQA